MIDVPTHSTSIADASTPLKQPSFKGYRLHMIPTTDDHIIKDENCRIYDNNPLPPTPDHLTRLSGGDNLFLLLDRSNHVTNIAMVCTFDSPLDMLRVHADIATLVRERPRFRQIPLAATALLPATWTDDPHFDLRRHIKERHFPPSASSIQDLRRYAGRWLAKPFAPSHPPWELRILHGLAIDLDSAASPGTSPPRGSAMIFRLHHCISDGQGLVLAFLRILSQSPTSYVPVPIPTLPTVPDPVSTLHKKSAVGLLVWLLLSVIRALFRNLYVTIIEIAAILSHQSPRLSPTDDTSAEKYVAWADVGSLEDIDHIRLPHPGVTMNDVIVGVLTEAFRRVHQRREGPPPNKIYLHIPISFRHPTDTTLGNKVAIGHFFSPLLRRSPKEIVLDGHAAMQVVKTSWIPSFWIAHLHMLGRSPLFNSSRLMTFAIDKSHGIMTNIRGPTEQLYFAGLPMRNIALLPPQLSRSSLGMSIVSNRGRITLTIVGGTSPHQQRLVDEVLEEFSLQMVRLVDECV